MQTKLIASALLGMLVIGVGGFFVGKQLLQLRSAETPNEFSNPWIEIVAPAVFELAEDQETELREFQTGDELKEGMIIQTGEDGLANIYFPDGSVARLDLKTTIILESGKYDSRSDSLVVRINLLWGNVWSKIIALTTPESSWEITTSTAVATVRGTAFGVEYREDGKASIVGYENKVEVKMVDPETKEVMEEVSMIVGPEKFLEVKKEAIQEMKAYLASGEASAGTAAVATQAGRVLMEVRQVPKEVLEKDWVKRAVQADEKLEAKLNQFKGRIQDEQAAKQESRKELVEESKIRIEERREVDQEKSEKRSEIIKEEVRAVREEVLEPVQNKIEDVKQLPINNLDIKKDEETVIGAGQETRVFPKGLEVVTDESLVEVIENTPIIFRAILNMSDGSSVDVTEKVDWQVLGPIGSFSKPGVFVGKLDLSVSELGEGTGTVIASWKNSETGEAFLGKSGIFKVQPQVDLNFDPFRG